MFCDEVLDSLEEIAAGDLTPGGRVADHLASCQNCAAALSDARELERLLRARTVPPVPSQFTARTMARVRRARWRSEQFLDLGFNITLAAIIVAVIGGIWMVLNLTGFSSVGTEAIALFNAAFFTLMDRLAPSLPLYLGAAGLLAAALGFWWWAERAT